MRGILNIDKAFFPSDNIYGFPELDPFLMSISSVDWYCFQDRSDVSLFSSSGLHFFCEDYIFDNVWNQPTKYIDIFKPFKYVVQPDFSLYYNFPVALQIFNKYRNHWLAKFFSFYGISVIPNINVSSPDCWNWSFLGYPRHSVVAFSDIGSYRDASDRSILFSAYDEMIKRLEPLQIVYFSRNSKNIPSECIPVIVNYGR